MLRGTRKYQWKAIFAMTRLHTPAVRNADVQFYLQEAHRLRAEYLRTTLHTGLNGLRGLFRRAPRRQTAAA